MTALAWGDDPQQVIDVRGYGAAGDGVTDDTTAIQAALDAVPAAGGIVFFPAGDYSVPNGGLSATNPVTIVGAGAGTYEGGGSRIVVTSQTANALTLNGNGSQVRDLAIYRDWNGSGHATAGAGILSNATIFSHFTRVLISGFYDLIHVAVGHYWTVTDSVLLNPVNAGIYSTTQTSWFDWGVPTVTGTVISKYGDTTNGGTGIIWTCGGGIKIANCYINSLAQPNYPSTGKFANGTVFSVLDGGSTSVLTMVGTSIENSSGVGIYVKQNGPSNNGNFSHIAISGCELTNHTTAAIALSPATASSVKNATITGNVIGAMPVGIAVGNTDGAIITGNTFYNITDTCISIQTGAIDTRHDNNNFVGNCSRLLNDSTADTQNLRGPYQQGYWRFERGVPAVTTSAFTTLWTVKHAQYVAGLIRVTITGAVTGVGSGMIRAERTFTKEATGAAVVLATVGTDVTAGTAPLIDFDTATTTGSVIVGVKIPSGTNFYGTCVIEIFGKVTSVTKNNPTTG